MTPAELMEARQKLGLNITEMAGRLNTPRGTYLKWERGERRVPPCLKVLIPLVLEKDGSI